MNISVLVIHARLIIHRHLWCSVALMAPLHLAVAFGLRRQALSIRHSITGAQYPALSIQRSAFRIHY